MSDNHTRSEFDPDPIRSKWPEDLPSRDFRRDVVSACPPSSYRQKYIRRKGGASFTSIVTLLIAGIIGISARVFDLLDTRLRNIAVEFIQKYGNRRTKW